MRPQTQDSDPGDGSSTPGDDRAVPPPKLRRLVRDILRRLRGGRNGRSSARDELDELIEERETAEIPLDEDERTLLVNILSLRDQTVEDVMVPRADIVAVESTASLEEVMEVMNRAGHSRLPVYRDTLDDALGMVHIKDVVTWRGEKQAFKPSKVLRPVLFVAPSMRVMELLLEMRIKRSHMALVVDEYGGVDGLVTIEDLVEEIVGEIQDEHDRALEPTFVRRPDGSIDADARTLVEALEEHFGPVLADDEREEIDTLGGLVFALAGRVPIRGELLSHPSGLEFEVVDADPRRVRRLRVRRAAPPPSQAAEKDPGEPVHPS